MYINPDFIVQDVDDIQFVVPVGGVAFAGLLRCNQTAASIVRMLESDIAYETIIDNMCSEYDAPRSVISEDVDDVLDALRSVGAIVE